MNQEYKIGDQVLITMVGTVIGAEISPVSGNVDYKIRFETEVRNYGLAIVNKEIMSQTNQKLSAEDIQALKAKGIQV
ncbi:hypothetical protein KW791_00400 [Candidatus Parcubacteria bacterium]|nr:hypothetical protein [Candidatus Parcubacteria bacterium]